MADPTDYFWDSCSGCYEAGEHMQLEEHYPRHPEHGCRVGAGCDECGGEGIIKIVCEPIDARSEYRALDAQLQAGRKAQHSEAEDDALLERMDAVWWRMSGVDTELVNEAAKAEAAESNPTQGGHRGR